jgi:hypothetical protein
MRTLKQLRSGDDRAKVIAAACNSVTDDRHEIPPWWGASRSRPAFVPLSVPA